MNANPYQIPHLDLTSNDPIVQQQITPTWRFLVFFGCMGLSTLILGGTIAGAIDFYDGVISPRPDFWEYVLQELDSGTLALLVAGFMGILFSGIGFMVLGIGLLRRRTVTRRVGMVLVMLSFLIYTLLMHISNP